MKNKKFDPFENLVLDDYEKELEASIARGEWVSVSPEEFKETKKLLVEAARNTLKLRKSKRVTIRLNQGDLIKVKARAKQANISYQTLLGALIRDYVEGNYSLKL